MLHCILQDGCISKLSGHNSYASAGPLQATFLLIWAEGAAQSCFSAIPCWLQTHLQLCCADVLMQRMHPLHLLLHWPHNVVLVGSFRSPSGLGGRTINFIWRMQVELWKLHSPNLGPLLGLGFFRVRVRRLVSRDKGLGFRV